MNQVILVGRLTRDPEFRALASGKMVATFSVATEGTAPDASGTEYTACVAWDSLAQIVATYCGKGQRVAVSGSLRTRQWDDETGHRHWRTEVVASSVELLSGRARRELEAAAS